MGSNVPPITPIRPPTTERAYPVAPGSTRAGPDRPGKRNRRPRGEPGADGPLATGSPVQPVANSPGDRRVRTGAVEWSDGAVLSNGAGADRLRRRTAIGAKITPRACRGRSEGRDEVRQLRGVAALDHVDDLAVGVGGGVSAPPQPPRLRIQPVRRPAALDHVPEHGQPRPAVVGPPVA